MEIDDMLIHPGKYDLGYDVRSKSLVRLQRNGKIPTGCVKIKKIVLSCNLESVYMDDYPDMLRLIFWSYPRYNVYDF